MITSVNTWTPYPTPTQDVTLPHGYINPSPSPLTRSSFFQSFPNAQITAIELPPAQVPSTKQLEITNAFLQLPIFRLRLLVRQREWLQRDQQRHQQPGPSLNFPSPQASCSDGCFQGNHYCSRDYSSSSGGSGYHYSNSNGEVASPAEDCCRAVIKLIKGMNVGSYYYSNPSGSTYYNSGTGYSQYNSGGGKK